MGNFDRNRNSRPSGGRSFERRGFNDRGSRGPVEMHQAICDNCRKSCEVPFRPTSGKPIFCSACFENNRGSEPRRSEGRSFDRPNNFEDRPMFEAVCDECRTNCKVPFQPSGGKPVFCSNCFGDKKNSGDRNSTPAVSQNNGQFEQLNNKLDKILALLTSEVDVEEPARNASASVAGGVTETAVIEEAPVKEIKVKAVKEVKESKKKPSKKK